jgi:hypothetical protein
VCNEKWARLERSGRRADALRREPVCADQLAEQITAADPIKVDEVGHSRLARRKRADRRPLPVWRKMEAYVARNPGTPLFVRPIYAGPSWSPAALDYGLLNGRELWSERFVNDV